MRVQTSRASSSRSNRSPVDGNGTPSPSHSSAKWPAPMPSQVRPPDSTSTVVTVLASTPGWRKWAPVARVSTRTRRVWAASQVSVVYASRQAPSGPPIIGWRQRWSATASPSTPASSARPATSASRGPRASASTGQPKSARWTIRRMTASSLRRSPVGGLDQLEEVAARVAEVEATAAVVVVDLAGPAGPGVGPDLTALGPHPGQAPVERLVVDQEGVVLGRDGAVGLLVVERDAVAQVDGGERPPLGGDLDAEHAGEEGGRRPPVPGVDDGVVQLHGHGLNVRRRIVRCLLISR